MHVHRNACFACGRRKKEEEIKKLGNYEAGVQEKKMRNLHS